MSNEPVLTPRRRRTGLIVGIAAAVAALGAGTALVFAHNGGMGGMHAMHGGMDPEEMLEHFEVHVNHALAAVDATPDQQAQVKAIVEAAVKDLKALHERVGSTHEELHAILTAPTIDRARLETLRVAHVQALDEASKRCLTALADAAEVLTPEQRSKLSVKFEMHH